MIQSNTISKPKRTRPTEQQLRDISEQIVSLSIPERTRFRNIVQRLAELDDDLADVHLCLPAIEIVFYLLREGPISAVSLTSWQMQAILNVEPQKISPN